MSLNINRHDDYPVVLNRSVLQDKTLSLEARGLYATVMSFPIAQELTAEILSEHVPGGQDSVDAALRELVEKGHLVEEAIR